MELLNLEIPEPISDEPDDVFRLPNPGPRWPLFPCQPATEFERRGHPRRLDAANPQQLSQLAGREPSQAPERPGGRPIDPLGDLQDPVPGASGP